MCAALVVDELPPADAPPPDHVLAYGPGAERVIDVRVPAGPGPFPLVVLLHGGFWRAAYDRTHLAPLCAALTARGYLTCSVEYHRIGHAAGGWPGTFVDVGVALDALPALLAPIAEWSAGVVAGHSAGGHLALWAAARGRLPSDAPGAAASPWRPGGVIALAPAADLAATSRLRLGNGAVHALLGGRPNKHPDRYAMADPTRLLPTGVPTTVLHGDGDALVPIEVSRGFVAVARSVGDPTTLRELPATGHFALVDPSTPAFEALVTALAYLSGGPR